MEMSSGPSPAMGGEPLARYFEQILKYFYGVCHLSNSSVILMKNLLSSPDCSHV